MNFTVFLIPNCKIHTIRTPFLSILLIFQQQSSILSLKSLSLRKETFKTTSNMFNSFGNIFRLTSFGESHGPGVGGVIDGFPAGIKIDMDFVQQELNRRRPGQ